MKGTLKNIKVVYKYGREFRSALFFELIGSIYGIVANILVPILSAKQIIYLTSSNWEQLIYMSLIIMLCWGSTSIVHGVLIRKNTQKFTVGLCTKMQKELCSEVVKISQKDVDGNSTGVFVQRITSDIDELASMFTTGFGRVVGIVSTIGTLIAVFIISPVTGVYFLIVTTVLTLLDIRKNKLIKEKESIRRKVGDKYVGLNTELIRGLRDIKMLYAKKSFTKVINNSCEDLYQKYLDTRNVDIKYSATIDVLGTIFEFLLVVLLVFLIRKNGLPVAMAITLFSYRNRFVDNFMEKLTRFLEEATKFNLSFERVFTLLDNKTFSKEKFGTKKLRKVNGDFEFKNVCFSYEDDINVLDNMSFKVDANTTVGFVGSSGAGKTTIFSLLCKLYDVNSGEILIDGHNINDLDESSIRGNITIIGQNPYIFNRSIIDNMKLVKEDVTLKEIKEACKLACLDEYIESLPDKYKTIVGEGGVTLSGGQKQRLAIARALIQKTEIILFDEATSALDNETQKKVQDAINNLKGDYTIMIIAHRFSTILNCDKIFFIDKGKVLDSGTHKELLARCKKYKKLYESEIKNKE